MKRKKLGLKPEPTTCASIGLDAALYIGALRYLFDRPVPAEKGAEWYWNIDEPDFAATPLQWTHIQTVLFANAGKDLAPYSDEQVGMGLNHVMSSNAGNIPHMANDPSVPVADALRMMQAFPDLWRDCLGPRLSHVRQPVGSSSDRLRYVCYMWFDLWPTFWNARHIPEWRDAMWHVFCEMLEVSCREVQISAWHGIGHTCHDLQRPQDLQDRLQRFMRNVSPDDQELKDYTCAAARGMVQ